MIAAYGDWLTGHLREWAGFVALLVALYFLFLHER